MTEKEVSAAPPRARSVPAWARHVGIGRSTAWALVAAGKLRDVRIGRRTLILDDDGERYLKSLPAVTP